MHIACPTVNASLLAGDGAFVGDVFPFSGDVIGAIEHAPVDIVAWCGMRLHADLAGYIGLDLHVETVCVARIPAMAWGIDEELSVPFVLRIGHGMDLDAAGVVVADAIQDGGSLHTASAITVLASQTGGVIAFAVAVLHPVGPGRVVV